jgi:hypothetical protein
VPVQLADDPPGSAPRSDGGRRADRKRAIWIGAGFGSSLACPVRASVPHDAVECVARGYGCRRAIWVLDRGRDDGDDGVGLDC